MRRCLAALILLAGLARGVSAQGVVVAPHAVYLDHRTRSGSITLYNPGADPAEVSVSFLYGYPVTDSAGNFTLFEPDSVSPAMPAAHTWIEAFPRRMVIAPLQRQMVRLLARPPAGLADGEYWARVMVSATAGSLPVSVPDTAGISVGLSLEVRTVIPLTYRKGSQRTGIAISSLAATRTADSLTVRARLERQGTSAYVGTATGTLVDSSGTARAGFTEPVAVYYDATPAFALPLAGLPAGRYRLRLQLTTERPDVAPELLLRTPAVSDSLEVVLR